MFDVLEEDEYAEVIMSESEYHHLVGGLIIKQAIYPEAYKYKRWRLMGIDFGWDDLFKYDDYRKYVRFSNSEFENFKSIIKFKDKNIKSTIVDRW